MSATNRIKRYLTCRNVPFELIAHPKRDTSVATAEVEHVPCEKMLKAVMARVEGRHAMIVVPADRVVDLFKVSTALGTSNISIEEEADFDCVFPDCERGAMPPMGMLYDIPCYLDRAVGNTAEVYFNAGSHGETIRMSLHDFVDLSDTVIGDYSVPRKKYGCES
ncbi:MAG: hypothetical protein A2Z83_09375 [Omnitrophica bacterium GWA2_52_8]|nr:MAG: hypothetical protein A2Z83_09375 [Omnitrophica bacterium GWA2_52_8]